MLEAIIVIIVGVASESSLCCLTLEDNFTYNSYKSTFQAILITPVNVIEIQFYF